MTQGCWATKRRCSFERIRFSSLRASALLSIFGRDSTLGRVARACLVTLFCEGDRASLELRYKLACDDTPGRRSVGLFVDRAHRVNITFPNSEQVLYVARFRQGLAKRLDEVISFGEALACPARQA